jgi:WD40-like Beta Propeller Repeat
VKQVFWFLCACIVPALLGGSLVSVSAQTSSPTPDPFTVQITSTPNAAFNSVLGDTSANGRFVVFVSNGDIATEKSATRNNADGNREIFLYDYAQRRIFQITNTKNVPNPTPTPSPTPTPTASPTPTPTPAPTPADLTQVKIEIDNRSPMISLAPALSGGQRVYTIVFSSNAPSPGNFDGTEGNLATDGNSELWVYRLPPVSDVDLTLGADLPFQDLAAGTFDQITDTKASRAPRPGSTTAAPFFADDNREPAISDDGNIVAFISTRDLVQGGNADGNPELFFVNVNTKAFTQATNTKDAVTGVGLTFQASPSLSSDGSRVAFTSSANLASNNADGNAEIFTADFGGGAVSNIRQVTRTLNGPTGNTNVLSPGRRLSRNGAFIAFESRATDPKGNTAATSQILGLFVYTIATDTFVEIGTRPATADIGRFPTFTDYNASLAPSSLVFASAENFRTDGTIPATAQVSEGLNPQGSAQVFLTALPAATTGPFIRLTNVPAVSTFGGTRPIPSETRKRIAFTLGGVELGTGNADLSIELYYLLTPTITAQSNAVLSFFTGASNMPVAAATPAPSPAPSPSPSPTPTPSPVPGAPLGLAPGELSIVRSTVPLAPADATASGASETKRSPALPVELNGVSLSVNGAAAGLYFVGNTNKQINFVMPIGLGPGVGTVAVNVLNAGANTDTLLRGFVQIIAAQPDIFTTSNDAGGRAIAFNVTNPNARTTEPFSVTSPDASGNVVATVIELSVTGVRLAAKSEITVTVGTTSITGDQIVLVQSNPEMPGFNIINFTLPASLAGAGDVPIQVTFTRTTAGTTTSRPADTAPHITIQ